MIKLINSFDEYDFSSFENDVFFNRIFSDYKTLSAFQNVMFYASVTEKDVNAVISKVGNNITISANKNISYDEINEFVKVIGFDKILCDKELSDCFDGQKTYGDILCIKGDAETDCKAIRLYTESLREMYELVQKNFSVKTDYLNWIADLSHRLRHNGASLYGIFAGDKLVSGAFSLFEAEKSVVISSVVTDEKFRCKGYGEAVVKTIIGKNSGKNIYVFTENDKTKKWYEKMGFVPYKMWSEIENVL